MQVCDSAMFIFLWNFTRKSESACLFFDCSCASCVCTYMETRSQTHAHMFMRLSVYHGMCFGSSCCVEGGLRIM